VRKERSGLRKVSGRTRIEEGKLALVVVVVVVDLQFEKRREKKE
jgi:hypothetical protein